MYGTLWHVLAFINTNAHQEEDMLRKRARLSTVLVTSLMFLFVSLPVLAQESRPEITSPETQTGFTEGDSVSVTGTGCNANVPFQVEVPGLEPQLVASGDTDDDGSFAADFIVPELTLPDVEETNEFSLRVTCDGQNDAVVIVLSEGTDDTLPVTGPTGPPSTGILGVSAVALFAGLFLVAAVRRERGSTSAR